jgi:transposase
MRKVREVLRLHHGGLTVREIARSLKLGRSTVSDYLRRARVAGVSWSAEPDAAALERLLFVPREEQRRGRPVPEWSEIHRELRRKHVTLLLLWEEYKSQHSDGYQYSQFCQHYRRWEKNTLGVWLRQEHRGGEKLFVDYSGDGIPWVDPHSGEAREAQLFVAALGASSYTYAEATQTQQLHDWLHAHVHALEYIGGVPAIIVPDQTRTAILKTCRYDPELNPAYAEFALHYQTCILPARPGKPRDKAKVEAAVLLAQRWIIAALRNRLFQSIEDINDAIDELLEKLNGRKMRRLGRSRRELFEDLDRPLLRPLPQKRFEFAEWKVGARVNMDYHIEFQRNFYSVPFQLARELVDIRATSTTVEIFHRHTRVTSHTLLCGKSRYSTHPEHMPRSHREHREWSPSRLLAWATRVGPSTAELIGHILQDRPHPEQGFRASLGILRLSKRYSAERLEKACRRAVACRSYSYRSVDSILRKNLEGQPLPHAPLEPLPLHENVRGSNYYN